MYPVSEEAKQAVESSKAVRKQTVRTVTPISSLVSTPTAEAVQATKQFLDAVLLSFDLKNDAHLARFLELDAPLVSKLRNGKANMSAEVMIRFHEKTGISIKEIKEAIGV